MKRRQSRPAFSRFRDPEAYEKHSVVRCNCRFQRILYETTVGPGTDLAWVDGLTRGKHGQGIMPYKVRCFIYRVSWRISLIDR